MYNGIKFPIVVRRAYFDYINGFDCMGPKPIYCWYNGSFFSKIP
jgi:hypothetical protein